MEHPLLRRIRSLYALRSAMALQGYDQETFMPSKGFAGRALMMEELEGVHHSRITDPHWMQDLQNAIPDSQGDERLCLERALEDAQRKARIPQELAQELAGTASRCQHLWSTARQTGDAQEFLQVLEKLVELKKREASCLALPGQSAYEALLQSYEPGMTIAELDPLFEELGSGLKQILQELQGQGKLNAPSVFEGLQFAETVQESYLQNLLPRMGFRLDQGRMDRSAHPFTESIHGNDVRITVRYRTDNPLDAFFSLLHEAGHGMYEQGFAEAWHFTPLAEAVSLGVHESQSRFWENCIGRSAEFWQGEYSHFMQAFPQAQGLSLPQLMQQVKRVALTPIRVEADEVTYNLHVILRYRMEKRIFGGELNFADIPQAWNQEFLALFGYEPANAQQGFLQDVHWSAGLFGYFPTYTLGNIWAAQLRETLLKEFPQWSDLLQQGNFAPILDWLRLHVHQAGRRWTPSQLMERATQQKLQAKSLLTYLRNNYLS